MRESTITCPETIKKRNGTPVPFDIKKISSAIHKANDAAMVEAISPLEAPSQNMTSKVWN